MWLGERIDRSKQECLDTSYVTMSERRHRYVIGTRLQYTNKRSIRTTGRLSGFRANEDHITHTGSKEIRTTDQ